MSMGIGGQDPFKSYASNAEAGGSMGVYIKRRKKNNKDEEENSKGGFLSSDEEDDEDIEIDMDDDFLL